MKKGVKYGLIIPGFIILGIIVLVIIAGLLIQTRPAKRKIARIAESQATRFIEGNLSIGKIEGNFFTSLSLINVLLTQDQDTVAFAPEIKTTYNLLPLLSNTLDIHSAEIVNPRVFLKQLNDSTWNVRKIVKPGPEKPASDSSTFFNIKVPDFKLTDGFVRIESADTIIPRRIENLNIDLAVLWTEQEQKAEMKQFSLATKTPDFSVKAIEFLLFKNGRFFELENLKIETAANRVNGEAGFSPETKEGNANLEIPELTLREFSYFLPSIRFPATPDIRLDARMEANSTRAMLELENEGQQLLLNVSSPNLIEFLFDSVATKLAYTLEGEFKNIDLAHWLGNTELAYILNGHLNATGRGIEPETAEATVSGALSNWVLKGNPVSNLSFDVALDHGNVNGQIEGHGPFGALHISTSVQNLFEVPVYQANISASNLNIESLAGIEDLDSDINLKASIKGREFDHEKLSVSAQINLFDSRLQQLFIDSLNATAAYHNKNLLVDTLLAKTKFAELSAGGNYSFTGQSGISFVARFSSLDEFQTWLPDSLQSSGVIKARLHGRPHDLFVDASAELDSTRFTTYELEKLKLTANAHLTPADTLFVAMLNASNLETGFMPVDSITAAVEGSLDSLSTGINIASKELNTELDAIVTLGNTLAIILQDWMIDYKDQQWSLQQPPATIHIDDSEYHVNNFILASGEAGTRQFLSLDGKISQTEEQDLELKINGLDIESLAEQLELEQPLSGYFDLQLELTGTPDSINLKSGFSVSEAQYDKIQFAEISGQLNYDNNLVNLETYVAPDDSGKIEFSVTLPVHARFDSMSFHIIGNEPLQGFLDISNISLEMLEKMEMTDELSGTLTSRFDFSGTSETPELEGKLSFDEATINEFRFVQFDGSLNYADNLLTADLLVMPQDGGRLEGNGEIPLTFNPDSLKFSLNPKDPLNGKITLEKLTLGLVEAMIPTGEFAGIIDGDIDVSGTMESPNSKGHISLTDASARLREYGIDYSGIQLNLNFLRDKAELSELVINSPDGKLTGSGQADFASEIYRGEISDSEIELNFDDFQLFNHRQFNIEIDGKATLGGKAGEVVYDGNITIPRSEVYIPAVLRLLGRTSVPELPKPILVEELERMELGIDTLVVADTIQIAGNDSIQIDYFDSFRGNLQINIPRNTWIKNDDMYIELSGDVELRKNAEFFELFGTVDVVRGQYDLLGKTFVVDEGSIAFQGGEEMAPYVNLTASYSFRNPERVEQILSVQVSGTPSEPEVNFELDGSPVSEGDAFSYILFGKSMDELTIDEQSNMDNAGGGSLAGKAAASILSSQLTNFLGEKLAVDYIEVKSEGSFENATVVVGKYVTNDLFVSYEQRFGETHEKDMVKYEVKLEYELFKFLFLELNNSSVSSGFDVIFKFDVE